MLFNYILVYPLESSNFSYISANQKVPVQSIIHLKISNDTIVSRTTKVTFPPSFFPIGQMVCVKKPMDADLKWTFGSGELKSKSVWVLFVMKL
jgi:hypothetical protein